MLTSLAVDLLRSPVEVHPDLEPGVCIGLEEGGRGAGMPVAHVQSGGMRARDKAAFAGR